jgi:hypothetical protein
MSVGTPQNPNERPGQPEDVYKTCGVCGKRYPDRVQYLAETKALLHNPEYPEGNMPDEEGPGHFFELRNCACGATLAVRIETTRDLSPVGVLRRDMFEDLMRLRMLQDHVDRNEARRRVMSKYGAFFARHTRDSRKDEPDSHDSQG